MEKGWYKNVYDDNGNHDDDDDLSHSVSWGKQWPILPCMEYLVAQCKHQGSFFMAQ